MINTDHFKGKNAPIFIQLGAEENIEEEASNYVYMNKISLSLVYQSYRRDVLYNSFCPQSPCPLDKFSILDNSHAFLNSKPYLDNALK